MSRPPYQFSLKAVLLLLTAVAVILGTWPYLVLGLVPFAVLWVAVVAAGSLLERVINGFQRLAKLGYPRLGYRRLGGPPRSRRARTRSPVHVATLADERASADVIESLLKLHQQVTRADVNVRSAIAYLRKMNRQLADNARNRTLEFCQVPAPVVPPDQPKRF